MKKLILSSLSFIIVLVMATSSLAQTFDYFNNEPEWRGSWMSASYNPDFPELPDVTITNYVFYLDGDSLYNEISYKKVFRKTVVTTNYDGSNSQGISFHALIRQEEDRIYEVVTGTEYLAYDFNLVVGDMVHESHYCDSSEEWIVISIDSVEIGGNFHRRFHFNDDEFLIEGIGHPYGFLDDLGVMVNGGSGLECYRQGEELILISSGSECDFDIIGIDENQLYEPSFSLFPNPATDKVQIRISNYPSDLVQIQIFNSIGQLLFNVTDIHDELLQLSTSDFVSGVYTIVLTTQEHRIDSKLLIVD